MGNSTREARLAQAVREETTSFPRNIESSLLILDLMRMPTDGGHISSRDVRTIVEIAAILISERGANVDFRDENRSTPLIMASRDSQKRELVNFFLKNGADVNANDDQHRTALMHAAMRGDVEIMKRLVFYEADVNLEDNKGYTALHFAAQSGLIETTRFLIENGADCTKRTQGGVTPLMLASRKRDEKLAQLLVETFPGDKREYVNASTDEGTTVLMFAAINDRWGTIDNLTAMGANLLARDSEGNYAISHAVIHGNYESFVVLMALNGLPTEASERIGLLELADKSSDPSIYEALYIQLCNMGDI